MRNIQVLAINLLQSDSHRKRKRKFEMRCSTRARVRIENVFFALNKSEKLFHRLQTNNENYMLNLSELRVKPFALNVYF